MTNRIEEIQRKREQLEERMNTLHRQYESGEIDYFEYTATAYDIGRQMREDS